MYIGIDGPAIIDGGASGGTDAVCEPCTGIGEGTGAGGGGTGGGGGATCARGTGIGAGRAANGLAGGCGRGGAGGGGDSAIAGRCSGSVWLLTQAPISAASSATRASPGITHSLIERFTAISTTLLAPSPAPPVAGRTAPVHTKTHLDR